ncbi:hypothetical protein [Krasilnikovia sp. M28-CT-15]|uniref:hypothetical protein n=1 Tax=Krasilnikovia sp. M28-CT-15 TaxID=3373540 RepID=UPI00399C9CC2
MAVDAPTRSRAGTTVVTDAGLPWQAPSGLSIVQRRWMLSGRELGRHLNFCSRTRTTVASDNSGAIVIAVIRGDSPVADIKKRIVDYAQSRNGERWT